MNSNKARASVIQIYDRVQLAVWVAIVVSAIAVFALIVAKLPEARAKAEAARILEIGSENDDFCRKWGIRPDAPTYAQCIADLQEFRAKVEKRFTDENAF